MNTAALLGQRDHKVCSSLAPKFSHWRWPLLVHPRNHLHLAPLTHYSNFRMMKAHAIRHYESHDLSYFHLTPLQKEWLGDGEMLQLGSSTLTWWLMFLTCVLCRTISTDALKRVLLSIKWISDKLTNPEFSYHSELGIVYEYNDETK